jgi:hypothetical protein
MKIEVTLHPDEGVSDLCQMKHRVRPLALPGGDALSLNRAGVRATDKLTAMAA